MNSVPGYGANYSIGRYLPDSVREVVREENIAGRVNRDAVIRGDRVQVQSRPDRRAAIVGIADDTVPRYRANHPSRRHPPDSIVPAVDNVERTRRGYRH